jgi:hypothetical protein
MFFSSKNAMNSLPKKTTLNFFSLHFQDMLLENFQFFKISSLGLQNKFSPFLNMFFENNKIVF